MDLKALKINSSEQKVSVYRITLFLSYSVFKDHTVKLYKRKEQLNRPKSNRQLKKEGQRQILL